MHTKETKQILITGSGRNDERVNHVSFQFNGRQEITGRFSFLISLIFVLLISVSSQANLPEIEIDKSEKVSLFYESDSEQDGILEPVVKIIAPADGDSVNCDDMIKGITIYPDKKHYVVITNTYGDDWVQRNSNLEIQPDGNWACLVRFGENRAGRGEKFKVRCIVTEAKLKAGLIHSLPKDAVISNSITVHRRFDSCTPMPPLRKK